MDPIWPDHLEDIAQALLSRSDRTRAALEELVRIPSISAAGHDPGVVRRSAQATAELLERCGLEDVELIELGDAPPYVYGAWQRAGEEAPSILLYAHHDVQPVNTPERWNSPPFEPTERDGRLYGRGTADDKAGILVHVAAVEAWLAARGHLPVNVKVLIEGEEEVGSPHLAQFLYAHGERLRADVIVITDVANWKVGVPALTYSLRGLAEVYVTVSALEQPLHSGMWGGPVPDALTGLLKTLASLTDARGRPAVATLFDDVRAPSARERARLEALDAEPAVLRAETGMLEGVEWVGDPEVSLLERMWLQPTITVIGLDVPNLRDASNQLIARARAKVSIRLAPGQDPQRVVRVVSDHLKSHVPWGLHVATEPGVATAAWMTEPSGPAFEAAEEAMRAAFGTDPAHLGCGGSIPLVAPLSDAFGRVPCLLTGIEDPATNAHGEDESLHLGDFVRACLAEAFLFHELGERTRALRPHTSSARTHDGERHPSQAR